MTSSTFTAKQLPTACTVTTTAWLLMYRLRIQSTSLCRRTYRRKQSVPFRLISAPRPGNIGTGAGNDRSTGQNSHHPGWSTPPRHEGLLVADRMNSRVVVLNPVSGNHVQTVPLDNMTGLLQMCLLGDQIIVWHNEDPFKKKEKISFISMPMFSWDKIPEAPPE